MNLRFEILRAVAKNPGAPMTEICDAIDHDSQKVKWSAIDCKKSGLLELARDDVTGQPGYHLTAAGKARLAEGPGKQAGGNQRKAAGIESEGSGADVKAQSAGIPPQVPPTPESEFSLLGVLADIRAAIGDPTGKIMLGELAEHIRGRIALLEAEPAALRAEIAKADSELDEVRAALAERIGGEIDHSDMSESEIARAAALVIDRHDDELVAQAGTIIELRSMVADLRFQLSEVAAERDGWRLRFDSPPADLRSEIARLKSEAVALDTLEAAMPGFGAAYQAQQKVAGYLVRAPKRPLRTFAKSESAQSAALAAARNGSGRGEVFALVPVGRAVRGAEWRPA
ncbi:hypothetical protein [Thauera aromatica]|uniref:hypothetical protein n=1 Tax=Thauera aromatica TaxID=59405 RepID=UPI001FFD68F7|nr:hypothetical protein [Thauera aromatica]MCK2097253.1 hypothetical protein [Thauera aromatica]